jgi:phenylpropionate dioxygenase-like ring-hydroxylating dioxygenase large terminal subunit
MKSNATGSGYLNPFPLTRADRIPVQRYYDRTFYELERRNVWSRVWQMACRLEEIPKPGDYVVYDIFDQSVIITRVDEKRVKAFHNACRHRGVQLAVDRGNAAQGFTCPFHGWSWRTDGKCQFVYTPSLFEKDQLKGQDLALRECRLETWGGCAFINFDDNAPPLRQSIEPFATIFDGWHAETLRTEWWLAARLPVNWKLAMEAFMEGYHTMATHPQLAPTGPDAATAGEGVVYAAMDKALMPAARYLTVSTAVPGSFDAQEFIKMNIEFMRTLSVGMAGMTHEKDIRVAESLLATPLPAEAPAALVEWRKKLNDAVLAYHREQGMDLPDLNQLEETSGVIAVNYCFPNYFLLPTFGSASSYRIRPLGPEECLFELWSLTRFPAGVEPPVIKTPTPMAPDDPRWPPIPMQDFSNLPRQQRGLHTAGFEFMRLSKDVEGLISNFHQLIDGYLAGAGYDALISAVQKVSGSIDVPILDLKLKSAEALEAPPAIEEPVTDAP